MSGRMHADLIAAIKAGRPRVHLVTVTLPDTTVRWTDGGAVPWGANIYAAHDATYGALDDIGDIVDGIDDDASPTSITILPPTLASIADLTAADAQGGRVEVHLGAVGVDGLLVSEPYRLGIGDLDQPRLLNGPVRKLEYDIITGDARGLEPNEEQRQTDAFHKLRWAGEKGQQYATDGTKRAYWRADEPKLSIGSLLGRGTPGEDKSIQFTYEPNAPFCFPFGECAVSGSVRRQIGYGPTHRWFSVFATVAASGPIEALVSASFDDEVTTFGANDRATNGDHSGEMWFTFLPGDQPSAALTSPTGTNAAGIPAPGWDSDYKLSGSAAYCWTGKENSKEDEYHGGVPKPQIRLKGLKGWDPRLDSTWPGGSGSCRLDDPTTWVWIEEGCIAGLNWSIGRWEGDSGGGAYGVPYQCFAVGGIGAPLDLIDVDSFIAGADIADLKGWVVSAPVYSDEDKSDVLSDLLKASGCYRARKGGRIACVPYAAVQTSVLTATEADTAAAVTVSLAPSRLERKNTGIGEFRSPDHRFEMTPIQAVTNTAWQTADGGRETAGFSYRFVPAATQCAQLTYYDLAIDRQSPSQVEFKPYMLQLEAGDCHDWDEPEYLLTGAKVRVEKRAYSPSSGLVKITFRPEDDAVHTDAAAKVGVAPPASVPAAPPDTYVEPIDGSTFIVTVDGSEVTVKWTNPTTNFFRALLYRNSVNDLGSATEITSYGGLGLDVTHIESPGSGTWYYWLVARDFEGEVSDETGPETATVP